MSNAAFSADVKRLGESLDRNVSDATGAIAVALHSRLAEATPYRSGRARASWNISQGDSPDLSVPPVHPGNLLDSTAEELIAARAFYEPFYAEQHSFVWQIPVDIIFVSNNLEYIELLNNGWSKQAPAGFFQLAVFEMELALNVHISQA